MADKPIKDESSAKKTSKTTKATAWGARHRQGLKKFGSK